MADLSRSGKIVGALCALLVVMGTASEATTFHQIWEVKYDYTSPEKLNIIVNGESQAPTFFAQKNDIIVLEVTNSLLTEILSVHLVGVRQIGNPRFGATQYPTVPGETFKYEFVIDKPGKYIYDYFGILEREPALYISIHVSDRKPEPFFNGYDQSNSEKFKPMIHSSQIMKKSTVAVRFKVENPGMNYEGYMTPNPLPLSPTGMNYERYIPSNPQPPIPIGINDNYEGFMPPVAPPSPTSTRFSLKVIMLIGASLTISLAVAFKIRNICQIICIWCPNDGSTGERR